MKSFLIIPGLIVLLQACATAELAAPTAPCASTAPDCGPAKPLNTTVAQASRGQGATFA